MVNLKRLTKKKKIQEIDDDDDKHELESKHKSNPNQLESNFTNSRVIPASLLLTDGWKGGIHSDASLLAETPQATPFKLLLADLELFRLIHLKKLKLFLITFVD